MKRFHSILPSMQSKCNEVAQKAMHKSLKIEDEIFLGSRITKIHIRHEIEWNVMWILIRSLEFCVVFNLPSENWLEIQLTKHNSLALHFTFRDSHGFTDSCLTVQLHFLHNFFQLFCWFFNNYFHIFSFQTFFCVVGFQLTIKLVGVQSVGLCRW